MIATMDSNTIVMKVPAIAFPITSSMSFGSDWEYLPFLVSIQLKIDIIMITTKRTKIARKPIGNPNSSVFLSP